MKKFILFAGSFLSLNTIAQVNLTWAKGMVGSGSSSISYGTAIDASNNVYATGTYVGTVDFDPGPGVYNLTSIAGGNDIYITKLNSAGALQWAKSIGGAGFDRARGITVDALGNILTVGAFNGTVDFDPGTSVFNLIGIGLTDIFISKLDASGNFIWAKGIGSSSVYNEAFSVITDATGNVYTTGGFQATADFDPGAGIYNLTAVGSNDCFVSKLNSSGAFVWAKNMGGLGGTNYAFSIAIDALGNVFTTGFFNATTDFDPGLGVYNLTPIGINDIFISKLNASGNLVWAKQFGGSLDNGGYGLAVDGSGNVISTGYFQGTVDFDPGPLTYTLVSGGTNNIYVSKLDASGNFVWAKSMNGAGVSDAGRSVALDVTGNIFLTGWFSALTDFDPGAGVFNMSPVGSNDIFLSKLDAAGNFGWAVQFGDLNDDQGKSIVLDATGNIYTTGYFGGTIDFDPSINVSNITALGQDIYVLKLCQLPNQPLAISGSTAVCSGAVGVYSIAPAAGASSYSWTLPIGYIGSSSTTSINTTASNLTGSITVTANNACGASVSQTLNVIVNPTPLIIANSGIICSGQSFTITASGASTYTYSSGSNIVSPTVNTSYSVTGTSAFGCVASNTAISTVAVNVCTGINELNSNTISIYPNPNNGVFTIELNATTQVMITSVLGNVLFNSTLDAGKQILDIKNHANGIYFVQLTQNGKQQTIKLIKE